MLINEMKSEVCTADAEKPSKISNVRFGPTPTNVSTSIPRVLCDRISYYAYISLYIQSFF